MQHIPFTYIDGKERFATEAAYPPGKPELVGRVEHIRAAGYHFESQYIGNGRAYLSVTRDGHDISRQVYDIYDGHDVYYALLTTLINDAYEVIVGDLGHVTVVAEEVIPAVFVPFDGEAAGNNDLDDLPTEGIKP